MEHKNYTNNELTKWTIYDGRYCRGSGSVNLTFDTEIDSDFVTIFSFTNVTNITDKKYHNRKKFPLSWPISARKKRK